MSIYEYDKEFEEKKLRKAEFEYGQHELLKTQIQKKLAKGKSINKFADALEGSPLVIRKSSMNWNMKGTSGIELNKKPSRDRKKTLYPVPPQSKHFNFLSSDLAME